MSSEVKTHEHLYVGRPTANPVLYNSSIVGQLTGYCIYCGHYFRLDETITKEMIDDNTRKFGHDWRIAEGHENHACFKCGIREHTEIGPYNPYESWYEQSFVWPDGREVTSLWETLICPQSELKPLSP